MADYDTFKHGGVTFPLTAATTNSLLRDADPAIFFVLEFYKNQLETHLGSRWTAEAALTSLSGTSIVAYTLPYDPAPYLNEQQIKFPLLAAFRAATNFGDRTVVWRNDTCTVQVAFVLPPLDAGQAERLLPILNAVKAVLDHQTEQGFYSTYTPSGSTAGANVWALSGVEKIELISATFGSYETTAGLNFPSIVCQLQIKERVMPVTGAFGDFVAANVDIDLDNAEGDEIADFVSIETNVVPPEEGN